MKPRDSRFVFAPLVLLSMTTFALGQAEPKKPVVQTQSTSAPGRYQIVMNPNIRADTFLLDAQTGKVWVRTEITNLEGSPTVWRPEDRVDSEQQFYEWGARQSPKKPPQPPQQPQ